MYRKKSNYQKAVDKLIPHAEVFANTIAPPDMTDKDGYKYWSKIMGEAWSKAFHTRE